MTKENWILLSGLVFAAAIPLVLGWLAGWPAWITVPLFVATIAGIYRKLMHGTRTAADHMGALLDKIGLYPTNPVRNLTAHRFAKLIEAAGNPVVAQEIRRKFDAPRAFGAPDPTLEDFPAGTRPVED